MDPRKLLEERANLITQARELLEKAEGEDRDLTQEEQNTWDTLMNKADELRQRVDRLERQADLDHELEQRNGSDPLHTQQDPEEQRSGQPNESERRMQAFQRILPAWLLNDYRSLPLQEFRALQADLDVSGGYLRPPEQFINDLIKAVDDMVFIRQWATSYTVTSAESMGVPSLDTDPADSNWTTELATGSEDSSMAVGRRELHPHPLAKRIKISRKLLRAVPSAEQLVRDRLAYKFGITYEKACLTGSGSGQPLGVFTASDDGISTDQDVSTGNTTTEIRFDGLIEVKYTLKPAYWPQARWLFHRDAVKQIAKLKDGEGQYLWRESVRVGEPDRILGFPAHMSEYAPNTFTSGLYVGILGAFANFWIADALTLEFQLLNELYAESNQVGLIGRLESDGMPVLEEAFVRVKLA
jgi:HK97 family phage major capsid protein